ncbi:uncharacterized protein LOC141905171 isoform X2 [Tubulanus polymorphus]|uniref:uncharacterized protein LOC141905171 isoform X2 n=1 Tax=Tubulanus polymorphus TaxID=672921 RepID=UPI003DA3D8CF
MNRRANQTGGTGGNQSQQNQNYKIRMKEISDQERLIQQKKKEIEDKMMKEKQKEQDDSSKNPPATTAKPQTSAKSTFSGAKMFGKRPGFQSWKESFKKAKTAAAATATNTEESQKSQPGQNVFSSDGSFLETFMRTQGIKAKVKEENIDDSDKGEVKTEKKDLKDSEKTEKANATVQVKTEDVKVKEEVKVKKEAPEPKPEKQKPPSLLDLPEIKPHFDRHHGTHRMQDMNHPMGPQHMNAPPQRMMHSRMAPPHHMDQQRHRMDGPHHRHDGPSHGHPMDRPQGFGSQPPPQMMPPNVQQQQGPPPQFNPNQQFNNQSPQFSQGPPPFNQPPPEHMPPGAPNFPPPGMNQGFNQPPIESQQHSGFHQGPPQMSGPPPNQPPHQANFGPQPPEQQPFGHGPPQPPGFSQGPPEPQFTQAMPPVTGFNPNPIDISQPRPPFGQGHMLPANNFNQPSEQASHQQFGQGPQMGNFNPEAPPFSQANSQMPGPGMNQQVSLPQQPDFSQRPPPQQGPPGFNLPPMQSNVLMQGRPNPGPSSPNLAPHQTPPPPGLLPPMPPNQAPQPGQTPPPFSQGMPFPRPPTPANQSEPRFSTPPPWATSQGNQGIMARDAGSPFTTSVSMSQPPDNIHMPPQGPPPGLMQMPNSQASPGMMHHSGPNLPPGQPIPPPPSHSQHEAILSGMPPRPSLSLPQQILTHSSVPNRMPMPPHPPQMMDLPPLPGPIQPPVGHQQPRPPMPMHGGPPPMSMPNFNQPPPEPRFSTTPPWQKSRMPGPGHQPPTGVPPHRGPTPERFPMSAPSHLPPISDFSSSNSDTYDPTNPTEEDRPTSSPPAGSSQQQSWPPSQKQQSEFYDPTNPTEGHSPQKEGMHQLPMMSQPQPGMLRQTSADIFKQEPNERVFPPDDPQLRQVIEKLASYVAKSGPHMQEIVTSRSRNDPNHWFLYEPDSQAYRYYMQRLHEHTGGRLGSSRSQMRSDIASGHDADVEDNYRGKIEERRKKKRRSRWGPDSDKSAGPPLASIPPPIPPPMASVEDAIRNIARQTTGSDVLTAEQAKQLQEQKHLQMMVEMITAKKKAMAAQAKAIEAGLRIKPKYEYDSDEDTQGGTWEHKFRDQEMEATRDWAQKLTEMGQGKHHIGDFLPPQELEQFMETFRALQEGREPDLSDYKQFKITCENVGFQMLEKMGWKEGEGLGPDGQGILNPVNKGSQPVNGGGLGIERPAELSKTDDEFDAYRKRMMLAYRFRPNPLNNPRRPYY